MKSEMATLNNNELDLDDPKLRIKPYQQMIAACTGALITSFIGMNNKRFIFNFNSVCNRFFCYFLVTPLDVVKIRLQAQQKAMLSNRCFLYCNGLMDHLCSCATGQGAISQAAWLKANGKFTGTLVRFIEKKLKQKKKK